jgi:FtsZ-binding cell division protein ZapB
MQDRLFESRFLLAIQAYQSNPKLSLRHLAKQYNIPRTTLQHRMAGRGPKSNKINGKPSLSLLEEEAIIQYILDLDARGFSPRRADVEDMANTLAGGRGAQRVGKCWTDRFIKRHPELCTRLSRVYDYQRALQEDPTTLSTWFSLFANIRAKYSIQDCDLYNFDETGFMMGMIRPSMVVTRSDRTSNPKAIQPGNREWATAICCAAADGYIIPPFLCVMGRFHLATWYSSGHIPSDWAIKTTPNGWTDHQTGLEWLEHFDRHTKARQQGIWRMLVLDGHESHINADFDQICKAKKIIPVCLPAHSSHLTQPLDIGVFSPLKRAYGSQISHRIRANITHITKDDFFPAFHAAFKAVFTEQNVKGGFRGAGLAPFDPDTVISKLDIRLRTPSPPGTPDGLSQPWISQTPRTAAEAISQSTLIKDQVARHRGSSPTPIFTSIERLTKATIATSHRLALLSVEVQELREANNILSKRRRAKRKRLQDSGMLTGEEASQLLVEKGIIEEERRDEGREEGSAKRRQGGKRLCSICRKTGHNARTCIEDEEIDSSADSSI